MFVSTKKAKGSISIAWFTATIAFAFSLACGFCLYLAHIGERNYQRHTLTSNIVSALGSKAANLISIVFEDLTRQIQYISTNPEILQEVAKNNLELALKELNHTSTDLAIIYDGKQIAATQNAPSRMAKLAEEGSDPLITKAFLGETAHGFLSEGGKVYGIVAAPIYPLNDRTDIKGAIILGQEINKEFLSSIFQYTGYEIAIVTPTGVIYPGQWSRKTFVPPLYPDSLRYAQLGKVIYFPKHIALPRIIKDYKGQSIGVAWLTLDPQIIGANYGQGIVKWMTFIFILAAVLAGTVFFFLRWFLHRPLIGTLAKKKRDLSLLNDRGLTGLIEEVVRVRKAVIRLQTAVSQSTYIRKTILHSINEGFQLLDLNGTVLEVNPAMCSLVGADKEKFLKSKDPFFFLEDDSKELCFEFMELARKGESNLRRGFEAKLDWGIDEQAKDVVVRLSTVEDEEVGETRICMFLERTRASEIERQFNIHEIGNMRMLVKFAGSIAHNMNNILTGVLSAVSLMEKKELSPPVMEKLLKSIREGVKRGTQLCDELLQMSKVRQARNTRSPVDISKVVHDLVRLSQELKEAKNCHFQIFVPDQPVLALCNESGLHHVLLNIVLNALDALPPEDGRIDIKVRYDTGQAGSDVLISVADNGCGIEEDVRKKIFEPFFTTKKAQGRERQKTFGGSGLGLTSSLETIKSWGGTIECSSKPGEGTVFTVRLPGVSASQHRGLDLDNGRKSV
ncbi:MAG: PAS domain-containing protein [Candidatus Dadabacteria bacterium]|nr:MAG: PAS domain-containing protein [Candidatus Dadabacteria bacterium]